MTSQATNNTPAQHSKGALDTSSALGTKRTILLSVAEDDKPTSGTWDSQVL